MGLAGRVPAGRTVDALRRSSGHSDFLLVQPGTGTVVALGSANRGAGMRADCVGLGRVEPRLGVATTERQGRPGAKAGASGSSRQHRGHDRRLGQRILRLRQPDGSADRSLVDMERMNTCLIPTGNAIYAWYVSDFLKLLSSKNNRLVWGAVITLSLLANRKPEEIFEHLDIVLAVWVIAIWGPNRLSRKQDGKEIAC